MQLDGWTLAWQALNLGVLLALLRWLFYRPLLDVVQRRRDALDAERQKAQAAREAADALQSSLASQRAAVAAERDGLLEAARHDAAEVQAQAHTAAQQARDALLQAGRHQLADERDAAARTLQAQAATLSVQLARQCLTALPGTEAADLAQARALFDRLAAQTAEQRARWSAPDPPEQLTLATAHPLDPADQAALVQRAVAVLGEDARLRCEVDPALLGGAELRWPHARLSRHWAASLAALGDRLKADDAGAVAGTGT